MNPFPDDGGSFFYGMTVGWCIPVAGWLAFYWCVKHDVADEAEPKYPRLMPDDDVPIHYNDALLLPPRPEFEETRQTTPLRYGHSPLNPPPPYGP